MKKDTFYFSHDFNTRTDSKIKRLLSKHGMAGYGVFWAIVEDLYNNSNALPTEYDTIAYDLRVDEILVSSIINDFGLFEIEDDYFGSMSIQARLDERNEKSKKARDNANKRWNKKQKDDATALPLESKPNAIKESKVNKNKRKETKVKESNNSEPAKAVRRMTLIFDEFYLKQKGTKFIWQDKEFSQLKNIEKMLNSKFKESGMPSTPENFDMSFKHLLDMSVKDKFIFAKLSPSMIYSQINSIITTDGKQASKKSTEQIVAEAAELLRNQ